MAANDELPRAYSQSTAGWQVQATSTLTFPAVAGCSWVVTDAYGKVQNFGAASNALGSLEVVCNGVVRWRMDLGESPAGAGVSPSTDTESFSGQLGCQVGQAVTVQCIPNPVPGLQTQASATAYLI